MSQFTTYHGSSLLNILNIGNGMTLYLTALPKLHIAENCEFIIKETTSASTLICAFWGQILCTPMTKTLNVAHCRWLV